MQLASYLERGPLIRMMPLHLHINQKSDYDDDDGQVWLNYSSNCYFTKTGQVLLFKQYDKISILSRLNKFGYFAQNDQIYKISVLSRLVKFGYNSEWWN